MHKFAFVLIFVLSNLVASLSYARDLTLTEKISDLDSLVTQMKAGYGPLHYKEQVFGIQIDRLRDQYAAQIAQTATNGEFYYLMIQFVAEFRDSHFSALIPTNRGAKLPFVADLVQGKVIVESASKAISMQPGDEILTFGGEPVMDVVQRLSRGSGAGYEMTALRKGAMRLAARNGAILPVPAGEVTVTVRPQASGAAEVKSLTFSWKVSGEGFDEFNARLSPFVLFDQRYNDLISSADVWAEFGKKSESSYRCSGKTRIKKPAGAVSISDTPFVAYYHPTPYGNVGYLRIPEYYPQNSITGEMEYELRFRQYQKAIAALEKNTVGLIIDQDHNCGGSVDFLHQIVSLFMDRPFVPMQFELLGNKEEWVSVQEELDGLEKSSELYAGLTDVLGLIKTAWNNGSFLTTKTSIDGAKWIQPFDGVRYTKPIVMLIDEMSGSGGDAFPAMMQGYGRAKLVGTRTMGAGGHVVSLPPLPYSRININYTKSLFYRPDGVPVENNGAQPDYPYAITLKDFTDGYQDYHAFALSKLFEELK